MADIIGAEPFDIPGYRIVRRLGSGGMADVYLAIQLSLGRPVAIKVLAAERTPSDALATRFEQEARTIARLDHPHIVGIFDVGRTSTGQLYYTMPHVPNGDLGTRDLKQDQSAIIEVVRALCQALAYAHEQGIVHRDVKPENILFDKLDRPLLADFGIALTTVGQTRVTREGDTLGSVAYMSPEQARGLALDGRSDIYSLGVVCYECLTGKLPFSGQDSISVALAHVEQPIPHLPPTGRHWQAFIDKAMAKRPDDRFQTASEMLDALHTVESRIAIPAPIAAVATTLATVSERLERSLNVPVRSRPTRAIAIIVLGLGILSVWLAYQVQIPASTQNVGTPTSANSSSNAAAIEDNSNAVVPRDPSLVTQPVSENTESSPSSDATTGTDQQSGAGGGTSADPSQPQAGGVIHDHGGPEMAVVPAKTQHRGKLYDIQHVFALGRYEVTRQEYAEFVVATGRSAASCRQPMRPWSLLERLDWRNPGFAQDDRHPVVCVSWEDASAYVQWLSKRTQHRYRLPSQSEWVFSAHLQSDSGSICTLGNVYDQSNSSFLHLSSRFNCNDGFTKTAPVGRFAPSTLGIYDLLGNVSEWTRDCVPDNSGAKPSDNHRCPERIFRGMSWRDGPDRHNLEFSGSAKSDVGYTTVGFRVAREIEEAEKVDDSR